MDIEAFVNEQMECLKRFESEWKAANQHNPSQYPLVLPADNAGQWHEMFSIFSETGKL